MNSSTSYFLLRPRGQAGGARRLTTNEDITKAAAPSISALPPGPRSPGIYQNLNWFFRPIPFIERCRARYGRVFTIRLGPDRNVVVVAEPELARQLITGPAEVYRAGDANGILRPVVGPSSMLVIDGDEHIRHRRILLPAFGSQHSQAFADQVRQVTGERVASWKPGDSIALEPEMERISFEAIMRVALGDEPPERIDRFRTLIPEMMRRCASPFTILPYFRRELGGVTPYARLRRVLDELDELFFAAIRQRRAAGGDLHEGGDALSLLVAATNEDGERLQEREIRDELLTLVMAGFETTSSALAWAFERLLRSPDALDKVVRALGDGDDTYLDAVVMETLRLRPVVPVVARKVSEPVTLGDHEVPAGTVLMASVYLMHRDPQLFSDPDSFTPERFLQGRTRGSAWIPFGGGVRRCLGASFAQLEMKVVLRTVLAGATLRAVDPSPEPVRRKRFTFAPGRQARVLVEAVGDR